MVAVAAVVAKRETVYQNNEVTPGAIYYYLALRSIQLGITSTENIGMYLYTSKINQANSLPIVI